MVELIGYVTRVYHMFKVFEDVKEQKFIRKRSFEDVNENKMELHNAHEISGNRFYINLSLIYGIKNCCLKDYLKFNKEKMIKILQKLETIYLQLLNCLLIL